MENEAFLESAFGLIAPICAGVGLVEVTPEYEKATDYADRTKLADELIRLLKMQYPDPTALAQPHGISVQISATAYPLLAQYVKRIELHSQPRGKSWVHVMPLGGTVELHRTL